MQMPKIRLTIRTIMILILGFAIVCHFGFAAWRVYTLDKKHLHTGFPDDQMMSKFKALPTVQDPNVYGYLFIDFTGVDVTETTISTYVKTPFWPAYWRRLLGYGWAGWPLDRRCRDTAGIEKERCELADPARDQ